MTADLGGSCADLTRWLPVAASLMAEPDTDGTAGGGQPSSRPPWNSAAANAALDAHEGIRRLEASLRLAVNGHPGLRRGGTMEHTMAAIGAIEDLGQAVTVKAMAQAAWILDRWSRQIQELPAVDEAEPWRRVTGVACPYCGFAMLATRPREGTVTCLRYGACEDGGGQHPVGRMEVGRLGPQVRWQDGLVAP